jgi:hypothetical protein
VGIIFYSNLASANILSFASQIDAGADITSDKVNDCFTMIPANGEFTYHFGRKDVTGNQGRFYVCDTRTMIDNNDEAHVANVEDNMKCYTKREIEQARKPRELLVRMGFPSVQQAIRTVSSGSNFDVTARDFEVADAIWGKDVASLKGKTQKKATPVADININPTLARQDQVLSVDIRFVQKTRCPDRGGDAPRSNPRYKPIFVRLTQTIKSPGHREEGTGVLPGSAQLAEFQDAPDHDRRQGSGGEVDYGAEFAWDRGRYKRSRRTRGESGVEDSGSDKPTSPRLHSITDSATHAHPLLRIKAELQA